jgi:hypothetical protein
MTTYRHFLAAAALGCAILLAPARAQSDAATPPAPSPATPANSSAWLLGQTYLQVGALLEQFRHLPGTATGAAPDLAGNLPISDNFDYSFSLDYEHATSPGFRLNENDIANAVTAYAKLGDVAPFATAGFGYTWLRTTDDGLAKRVDSLTGSVAAGIEVPIGDTTSLRATVGNEDFLEKRRHDVTYGLSANAWLSSALGTYVGADVKQGYDGERDSILYSAGFRFLFE